MTGGRRYGEVLGFSCQDFGICRHTVDVDGLTTMEQTM